MELDELKQADVKSQYLEMLILHLDELTILYRNLLIQYAKSTIDEELFDKCISETVVLIDHLLPKLEGGGDSTAELVEEFKEFEGWTNNILLPKGRVEERKKLHKAFKLIIKAYNVLGLTKY